MDYQELLSRVTLPIYSDEGIIGCINSCLEPNKKNEVGMNKQHRNMRLSTYRAPISNGNITSQDKDNFICEIVRYLSSSLYEEFINITNSNDEYICNVSEYIKNKYPELNDLKISDLLQVSKMSNEEILNNKNNKYINIIFNTMNIFDNNGDLIEHCCSDPLYEHVSPLDTDIGVKHGGYSLYSKRIYINGAADKNELLFILELIKKCIDRRIPCDMKPMFNHDSIDGTIIYSDNNNFLMLLESLEEVIEEHPELTSSLGTPIISGANVVSNDGQVYYAFCNGGGDISKRQLGTYNDRVDKIINYTYTLACLNTLFYFYAATYKDLPSELLELKSISKSNSTNLSYLDKYERIIREYTYKFLMLDKENFNNRYNILKTYFTKYLGYITSIVNFNDLDHLDIPMYKDESFIIFEEEVLDITPKL